MAKGKIIKNLLLAMLWTAVGAGTIVLLVAAIRTKDARHCSGVEININGVQNNCFVDRNDILDVIRSICGGVPVGKPVGSFDLQALELALQKNVWVKSAQLFFDNNEKLQVNVVEREPVARVFSTAGTTFYVDSSAAMLPLSSKFSARLPVFTNFPSDKKVLLKADSNLLKSIVTVSRAIQADSFYMAMIDQVDITPGRTFEMVPKLGNSVIVFGDAKNASEKLNKMQVFYKEIMVKAGWNKYSEINVQYANQVVAKRKGAAEVKADSLRTLQLMKVIAETAEKLAGDSLQTIVPDNDKNTTSSSLIQESLERDDRATSANEYEEPTTRDSSAVPVNAPVKGSPATASKPVALEQPKKNATVPGPTHAAEKPATKKSTDAVKTPRLVMPKKVPAPTVPKNDY